MHPLQLLKGLLSFSCDCVDCELKRGKTREQIEKDGWDLLNSVPEIVKASCPNKSEFVQRAAFLKDEPDE